MQQLERKREAARGAARYWVIFVAYQHISEGPVIQWFHPEDYQVADLSKDRSKRLQQTECEANLLLMAYKNS